MKIIRAKYSVTDVTDIIKQKVVDNRLVIRVDNNICGDPSIGVVKSLTIDYEIEGKLFTKACSENSILSIPDSKYDRLGIFYSNNNNPETYKTINDSLESIRIACEGKADILTCVWNPISTNPFVQIIAQTKTTSHLNQVLQILQLLYTARNINQYKYVSFLEHDCLYPIGTFDYPDFDEGMICNMNYIGVCRGGWQKRNQDDKPLSQITMRFDDAIKHFESILPNAILTNSGLVEPQLKINEWMSENSSVHVNHGHHFTSHFSIYSKDNLTENHPYWGNYNVYLK